MRSTNARAIESTGKGKLATKNKYRQNYRRVSSAIAVAAAVNENLYTDYYATFHGRFRTFIFVSNNFAMKSTMKKALLHFQDHFDRLVRIYLVKIRQYVKRHR